SWDVWRGGDDGFANEAAILWLTEDRDVTGTLYVIAELYAKQQTPQMLAQRVLAIDRSIPVDVGYEIIPNDYPLDGLIDSAAFSQTGATEFSRADQMNRLGCKWRPVEKGQGSRIAGVAEIHRRLALRKDGTPGLKIFRRCKNLIRVLPSLVVDPRNSE